MAFYSGWQESCLPRMPAVHRSFPCEANHDDCILGELFSGISRTVCLGRDLRVAKARSARIALQFQAAARAFQPGSGPGDSLYPAPSAVSMRTCNLGLGPKFFLD